MVVAGLVVLTIVGFGLVVVLSDQSDEADDADERAAQVALVTAPRDLLVALQDERNMASVSLLGMADAVAMPVADNGEARRLTDTAASEFEVTAAEAAEAGEPAYGDALGALDGLDELRAQIDGRAQPPGLSEMPFVTQIRAGYSEIIAALLDANRQVASEIDDPELRRGAELFETALRQAELVSLLAVELTADPAGWNTPEAISRVAELYGQLEQGRTFVTEYAEGAYADAADQLDAELQAAGAHDAVNQVLASGQVDLSQMVTVIGSMGQSWLTFLDNVQDTMTRAG